MSKVGLILKREYGSRVRKKSFIIMTLLGPLLIAGFYGGAIFLGTQESGPTKVLLLDETTMSNRNDFADNSEFTFRSFTKSDKDLFDTIASLPDGSRTVGISIPQDPFRTNTATIYIKEAISSGREAELKGMIRAFFERMLVEKKDMDIAAFDEVKKYKMNIPVMDVMTNQQNTAQIKAMIGIMFAVVIYMFIFMYGVMVMRGVIEEKTSRIVEVMVSSVKPFQLMMGKICGIALVGLTQFAVWIVLGGVLTIFVQTSLLPDKYDPAQTTTGQTIMASEQLMNSGELHDQSKTEVDSAVEAILSTPWLELICLFIFYFLAGYLLYASLFAAVGSAVDNETETQQFMLPITLPLIFGFIVSIMGVMNPGGSALIWLSYIPFTSPVAMLVRVAMGEVVWWEILTSAVILILTFLLTTRLAAKIYRTGILMYGKKVTYRELFKWLKYK